MKAGKEPCRTGLARDAWHLMLTNLGTDQASVSPLAAMIVHQLGMKFAQVVGHRVGPARLSYERLYHVLTSHLIGVVDLAGLEKSDQDLDARHVTRDKRSRQSPIESGIQALT